MMGCSSAPVASREWEYFPDKTARPMVTFLNEPSDSGDRAHSFRY